MLSSLVLFLLLVSPLGNAADLANPQDCAKGQAETKPAATNPICSVSPRKEDVWEAIRATLKPFVRKTKRSVSFYHYGGRPWGMPADGPIALDAKEVRRYFESQAAAHFDSNQQPGEFGYGLYAATEPLASVGYSRGFLVRVTVPEGIGYLDLREVHRDIPMKEENAVRVACFMKSTCKGNECEGEFARDLKRLTENGFDPKPLLRNPATRTILEELYKELGVAFINAAWGKYQFKECKLNPKADFMADAIFIDPTYSLRFDVSGFVPILEEKPSVEKLKQYQEVFKYFEAFDWDDQDDTTFFRHGGADPGTIAAYWQYYKALASVIHHLPAETDFVAFQKQRSKELRKKGRKEITESLFGCSDKPEFKEEVFPPTK